VSGVSELIRALVAGLAVLAGGCTLVDQRTFRAAEAQAGVDEIARAVLPALPLIVVRFDGPIDRAAIAQAVELAQARREAAVFDVIAPIPTGASPAVQEAALAQGRADAERVASVLAEAGAPRGRIEIGARGERVAGVREIRVYVR
jgi:hypothetical protein